jgi:CRP/FNR family transcriptional regulator, cyclic AMP receptor protein
MTGAVSGYDAEGVIARAFGCGPEVTAQITASAAFRSYPARGAILRAGEVNEKVYLVVEGTAEAVALSIDGRLVLVEDYQVGDVFGEASLTGAVTVSEDVMARDRVAAGHFSAVFFSGLIENHGSIALAVSRTLTRRLTKATRRMIEGATLSAQGRIYAELLRQARNGDDMVIRPAPVLAAFAQRVQSTRETVSRAINLLEKRGIIRRDAAGLTIVAPHRLEELIY